MMMNYHELSIQDGILPARAARSTKNTTENEVRVQDKILHFAGRDGALRRPGVAARRPYH